MKSYDIRLAPVLLWGRYDKALPGFTMTYSGCSVIASARCSRLEAEIECGYDAYRHYISFEVDGLTAQTFSPLPGKHVYTVFMGMNKDTAHRVRIIKETQAFSDGSFVRVTRLRCDGELLPIDPPRRRIEFIGDSITAGEGGRGPEDFDEWMPMMFSSCNNYSRLTADALNAAYSVAAVSGWGAKCSWDNVQQNNVPRIYDRICGVNSDAPYDFRFDPDTVVVALGTNDNGAAAQPPYTDPVTGETYKLTDSPEDTKLLEDAACEFIKRLRGFNPNANIIWLTFFSGGRVHDALSRAVARAAADGVPCVFLEGCDLYNLPRNGMGSRRHPGPVTHRLIAKRLVKAIKDLDKQHK